MRAILIDAVNRTVTEIQNKGDNDSIYRAINVQCIEIAHYNPDTGDTLYVDEEGRINGTTVGFELYGKQLAGSGIIFGTQPDGENGPAAIDLKDVNPRFFTFQPALV